MHCGNRQYSNVTPAQVFGQVTFVPGRLGQYFANSFTDLAGWSPERTLALKVARTQSWLLKAREGSSTNISADIKKRYHCDEPVDDETSLSKPKEKL